MKCLEQFTTSISDGANGQILLCIFVVDADTDDLLSCSVACDLDLVQRAKRINNIETTVFSEFYNKPSQCKLIKIKFRNSVGTHNLATAYRTAMPIVEMVKSELDRMQRDGKWKEITEPTDRCATMVPVVKKNDKLRICTDFKEPNKVVKHERYLISFLIPIN